VTARPTAVVVGAGPAALACVHRLRVDPGVRVVLVAPGGASEYLAGALAVATGDVDASRFRAPVRLDGVEVVAATADALGPGFVRVDGRDLSADAVIAAPGLATDPVGATLGGAPTEGIVGFWDLAGAAAAAPVIEAFTRGVLTVVIATPLHRCPPAPYGLAIRLARRAARLGHDVRVRLTTPEPRPLAAIGSAVTGLLLDSCAAAGVEIRFDVQPDPDALAAGHLSGSDAESLATDLAVVVPPHRAHPLLADLAGTAPLVVADANGRTDAGAVYVAGDAVASPSPGAAAPAMMSGIAAAEGALADLGLVPAGVVALPEPDCFLDQGGGLYSRIQLSYPSGPPPAGKAAAVVGGPEPAADGGFDAAVERWRRACEDPR